VDQERKEGGKEGREEGRQKNKQQIAALWKVYMRHEFMIL